MLSDQRNLFIVQVYAVKDGVYSESRNEILVTPQEAGEVEWYQGYQAEGALNTEKTEFILDNGISALQFSEEGAFIEVENVPESEQIEICYRSTGDATATIFCGEQPVGTVSLLSSGGEWAKASLTFEQPVSGTISIVKDNPGEAFDIDYFTMIPHANLSNYALEKSVTADSETIWAGNGYMANLTDGDPNTFWESSTVATTESPDYAVIDLGEPHEIQDILIRLPLISDWGTRTEEIQISVSEDGDTFNVVSERKPYTFGCREENNTKCVVLEETIVARYVKIEVFTNTLNGNRAQIGEVEILGEAKDEPIPSGEQNLALDATVTGTENLPVWSSPVTVLNDGSTNQVWEAIETGYSPTAEDPNWAEFEWGETAELSKVTFKLPDSASWSTRTEMIQIKAKDANGDYQIVVPYTQYEFSPDKHNMVTVELPDEIQTNSVRIEIYGNSEAGGRAQMSEVEIYGTIIEMEKTIEFVQPQNSVEAGKTLQLEVKVNPEESDIVWSSSNIQVATVDENGLVTALQPGTVEITARIAGTDVKAVCTISVTPAEDDKTPPVINLSGDQKNDKYIGPVTITVTDDTAVASIFVNDVEHITENPIICDQIGVYNVVATDKAGNTSTVTFEIVVDKSELEALYNANKDKTQGDYTDASWKTFVEALNTAKNVLDDPAATADDVAQAIEILSSAILGLTENSGTSGDPDKPSNPDESSDSSSSETNGPNTGSDNMALITTLVSFLLTGIGFALVLLKKRKEQYR